MTSRWQQRLPMGVELQGQNRDGFSFGVAMPLDGDDAWLCQCAQAADHRFKLFVDPEDADLDRSVHCPYCGRQGSLSDFFTREQEARITRAAEAVTEQYVHDAVDKMLRRAFGQRGSRPRSGAFSIQVTASPRRPPRRRQLPALASEPTRALVACVQCGDGAAVYGLALYCPGCGQMAPVQQFAQQLNAHSERLAVIDQLPEEQARALREAGVLTLTHESTIKDGFTALETYLKARFTQTAPTVNLQGKGNVFQRLDDGNALFVQHLGIHLAALVGPDHWQTLKTGAALRHVLTHNSGVIDERFLNQQPGWPQACGQRVIVDRTGVEQFLAALEAAGSALQ